MGSAASSNASAAATSPAKKQKASKPTSSTSSSSSSSASTKKHASPSFFSHVVVPLALAPIVFTAMILVARQVGPKLFESTPERPAFLVLPYFGGSLTPAVFGLALYWCKKSRGVLGKIVSFLPLILLLVRNFFVVLYGNVNNDAYSDSLMIDVIAPPSAFTSFDYLPREFSLATNPSTWANEELISGAHIDIRTVHDTKCGERSFARFMYHTILPKSRVTHLLEGSHIMFGGVWLMVDGKSRPGRPKVFTDFAYGNDNFFNHAMRILLVDEYNWFGPYTFTIGTARWQIDSFVTPYNASAKIQADMGAELEPQPFWMDQYSCMSETNWLDLVTGRRFCFYKKMEPVQNLAATGSITHPKLSAGTLSFPSGSADDCSQPYVRGVLGRGLHWTRPTYEC